MEVASVAIMNKMQYFSCLIWVVFTLFPFYANGQESERNAQVEQGYASLRTEEMEPQEIVDSIRGAINPSKTEAVEDLVLLEVARLSKELLPNDEFKAKEINKRIIIDIEIRRNKENDYVIDYKIAKYYYDSGQYEDAIKVLKKYERSLHKNRSITELYYKIYALINHKNENN